MPVVLRSRIKEEDGGEAGSKSSSPKPVVRRAKRRKRNSGDSENGDVSGSDEFSGHLHGTMENGRPFEMIGGLPSSSGVPQYNSALMHPLSVKDSAVLYYSLVTSRKTWVRGEMFKLYFTKTAKPAKDPANNAGDTPSQTATIQVRDKMQKMCDCTMLGGPHTFPVRLFILKDEEMEKKWQEEQDMKKKEREEARRKGKEEKQRLAEKKKQIQQQKKQEREKLMQMRKENKVKAKEELDATKQRQRVDTKNVKVDPKKVKRTGSVVSSAPGVRAPGPSSQSVTNPKMIANLNLMAQRDPKLNALMAIVANGDATLEQVEEFKKFIEIAKKMPPPPGWSPPSQVIQQVERRDTRPNVSSVEGKPAKTQEVTPSESKELNKQSAGDTKPERPTPQDTTVIKKEEKSKLKNGEDSNQQSENGLDEKSMQLTAFQQKYVEGAQIILEFMEYTTSRFLLPRNAIIEFVEEDGSFLLSWIIVHNDSDIRRHRSKRIRELSKGLKTDQEKEELAKSYDVYSERGCPSPLYSPMTVKFTGIHPKFARILQNSVDPAEKVRAEMTTIMEIGTRLSGYNLWYQLDAYDDKDLAERLRVKLNEHEEESKGRKHRQ